MSPKVTMKIDTPISTAEARLTAIQAAWSKVFVFSLVNWLGCVAGYWLYWHCFNLWVGNPFTWLLYQCDALGSFWGLLFLILQAMAFFIWFFTDSFRRLSLIVCFFANSAVVILVEFFNYNTIIVDTTWFGVYGLISIVILGTFLGWFLFRTARKIVNRRTANHASKVTTSRLGHPGVRGR
jgi:hypothetical protein